MTPLEIICVLFAIAAVFGMISVRWFKLPITVGTMLLTVVASGALIAANPIIPQVHQWAAEMASRIDFEMVILHGMLPLLLFAGAFLLDLNELAKEKLTVSLLASVGTVMSVFLVAGLMFIMPGIGIPWIQCLIFGALISPTDPVAVLEMLRRVGVSKSIQAQLAGESLFNDGIGAVLFLTMIEVARGQSPTALNVGEFLLLKAGGAIVAGIAAAWITSQLIRRVNSYQVDILFTITLALGGYVMADLLHLSAPLEAVAAGIALRLFTRNFHKDEIDHDSVDGFWEVIDEIQNSVLFVLLGLEILARRFCRHFLCEFGALCRGCSSVGLGQAYQTWPQKLSFRAHLGRPARRPVHRACALSSSRVGPLMDAWSNVCCCRLLHRHSRWINGYVPAPAKEQNRFRVIIFSFAFYASCVLLVRTRLCSSTWKTTSNSAIWEPTGALRFSPASLRSLRWPTSFW